MKQLQSHLYNMKRLTLWLALLLPFFANAQVNGTIQKTVSTGTIRGNFGSIGVDTLPRVTGVLVDGYILKYHAATNKWYASPDGYIAGLQDSLTKKANRTFDNVASGAIANVKLANSTISGVSLGSNLNTLTLGNGLTGTSYNGSANVTARADTAVVQTVLNFFPKGDTRYAKISGGSGYIQNQTASNQTGAFRVGSDSYVNDLRIGRGAGNDTTNTVLGRLALRDNTTGKYGTFLGYRSGMRNTIGEYNTFLGYFTGQANTTGGLNTFIGAQAGFKNTSGSYNLAIGVEALNNNTTGANNTAVGGYDALLANTTGTNNAAFGYASMISNTTGNNNTALGTNALYTNTNAEGSTSVGHNSLNKNNANYNTAIGSSALYNTTSGISNFAGGINAGYGNTTGKEGVHIGEGAGYNGTTGNHNVNIGQLSGFTNITGRRNTYIGTGAGYSATGSSNIAIGYNAALKSNSDSSQLSIGNAIYGNLQTGDIEIKRYLYLPNIQAGTAGSDSALVINSDNSIRRTAPTLPFANLSGTTNYIPVFTGTNTAGSSNIYQGTNGNIGIGSNSPVTAAGWTSLTLNNATNGGFISLAAGGTEYGRFIANSSSTQLRSTTATDLVLGTNNISGLIMNGSTQAVNIATLAGSGTRMVVANNLGDLSTQTIPSGGGGGTVTTVSVNNANGLSGTSSGGANPALTLTTTINSPVLAGNGTAISAATTTGSGSTVVLATSPTLTTPNLGTPSALVGTNITGTASALNIGGTAANATTWNGATRSGSTATGMTHFMSYNGTTFEVAPASVAQTFLGLGSNAYTSTAYAPLASPALTGNPTAPTQTQGDNSTKIATTAYVDALGGTILGAQKQIATTYTNISTSGTSEQSLFNANIAQSNLSNDGDRIDFNFIGSFGLNANDKYVRISVGGNLIPITGNASNKSVWEFEGYLMRTSSTTYRIFIKSGVDYVYTSTVLDKIVTDFNPLNFQILGQTNNASFPVTVQMGYLQARKAP